MRSVYTKILLWCFGVLVLSLAAFIGISIFVSFLVPGRNLFVNTTDLQLEQAKETYEAGGAKALSAYFARLNRIFHSEYFFIDASAKDLITGEDRSLLLARAGRRRSRFPHMGGENHIIVKQSADGRYRLLIVMQVPLDLTS